MISVQSKSLKGYIEKLKETFNYALRENNYSNWIRNRIRTKCLICKNAWKKILRLATLKSSARLNLQGLREEHDEILNAAKNNGTTETIEELDKLRQILKDKKVVLWKLVKSKTFLEKNSRP